MDCSDRHPNCPSWNQQGECTRNAKWMAENCRKSCNRCGRTRAATCGGGAGGQVATQAPQPQFKCENSEGCYNENACCPHWALFGECRKSPAWMACNCRVSCGHCFPTDYNYGSENFAVEPIFASKAILRLSACTDYHRECAGWARLGECEKNPWMSENCRASCRTCYSQWDLRDMCRGAVGRSLSNNQSEITRKKISPGSVAPVAQRRPQPSRTQFEQRWGNFGDFDNGWWEGGRRGGRGGWGGRRPIGWGWERARRNLRNHFPRK
ncbi:unnamed protein product [Strongylus vulgaris]|uniref:ShKT domain-containing protein n=1 Tax=Strongylus vulgaris TaxID=40348 RepID=A0A3P7IFD1_STRVU|nr:unnamed protein product [Strongylus vulgaris]